MSDRKSFIAKWHVPIGDTVAIGGGKVVHVACLESPTVVQVWTEEEKGVEPEMRKAMVVGTGQPYPWVCTVVGTAIYFDPAEMSGPAVWHVITAPREPRTVT